MLKLFRVMAVFLASGLAAFPAWAAGKPKHCLKPAEIKAEQVIHHGVFLREASRRCEEMTPGIGKKWLAFDTNFGTRLRLQTEARKKMFEREFGADALKVRTYFDGRLVTYHRYMPKTKPHCEQINEMLDEINKSGWSAFSNQATIVQNTVIDDYKACK